MRAPKLVVATSVLERSKIRVLSYSSNFLMATDRVG
jgi:hypothetical protein